MPMQEEYILMLCDAWTRVGGSSLTSESHFQIILLFLDYLEGFNNSSISEALDLSFSSPSLQSKFKVSDFLLRHQGSRRTRENLENRDRRVHVGLLLAT